MEKVYCPVHNGTVDLTYQVPYLTTLSFCRASMRAEDRNYARIWKLSKEFLCVPWAASPQVQIFKAAKE